MDKEARLARRRKRDEEARRAKDAKKARHSAKRVKEVEARMANRLTKAANIKFAQEEKLAADLKREAKRVRHVQRLEEARVRKEANAMMAQRNGSSAHEEKWDGVSDLERMDGIEAVAGEEPEISALLEAMKQQHRDLEDFKTALLG